MANVLALIAIIVTLFNSASTQWPPYNPEGALCKSHLKTSGECTALENCTYNKQARRYLVAVDFIDCNAVSTNKVICCPNESFKSRLSELSNRFIEVRPYDDEELIEKAGVNYEDKAEKACQRYRLEKYIINGVRALKNEFPHMAAIGYPTPEKPIEWNCGGSLISERFVLTAAHCIVTKVKPVKVRLGETDIQKPQVLKNDFNVEYTLPHPRYKSRLSYDDIGLIYLDRTVKFSSNVKPACLAMPEVTTDIISGKWNQVMIATGWGATASNGFRPSDVLLKAHLTFQPLEKCKQYFKRGIYIPRGIIDNMMCAQDPRKQMDTCRGDSGGPLQILEDPDSPIYTIVGVTSFGAGICGGSPSVYSIVSSHLQWIQDEVWISLNGLTTL